MGQPACLNNLREYDGQLRAKLHFRPVGCGQTESAAEIFSSSDCPVFVVLDGTIQHLLQSSLAEVDFVPERLLCLFLKTEKHHDRIGHGDEVQHPYCRCGISYPEFMSARCDRRHRATQRETESDSLLNVAKSLADLRFDCRCLHADKGKRLRVKRDRLYGRECVPKSGHAQARKSGVVA